MTECEFCRIVSRATPAEVIYETEHTLAFFPLAPATRGHTMVIPKKHIPNFLQARPSDVPELGTTVLLLGRALDAVMRPDGMNVITSAGEAASQSVMHLHVHLVPRWVDDAVGEIWPPQAFTPTEVLEHSADALRAYCRSEYLEDRNPD